MPTAAPPERDDARWQFLREWWEELRSPAPPMVEGTPSMTGQRCGYGRMRVFPPVDDARAAERWSTQRDALELAALLSRVDAPAFLRMLREFCVPNHGFESDWRDFPDDEDFEAPLAVEIRIEDDMLGDGDTTEWAENMLSTLFAPVPLSMRTRRFRNARKEVLSHVTSDQERQDIEASFVVPVQVGMWVGPPAPAITIVEKLAALQQQMQNAHVESNEKMEEARRAALRAFPFRLKSVDVIADDETLSPAFMKSVRRHVMGNTIKLRDVIVRASDLESGSPIDRRGFAHYVTAVCAPSGQSVIYDIPDRTGAKGVRVEASLGLFPFVQLCSALTFSNGVQELVVDDMLELPDDMSRRQRWAMILYAVFSAEAKNDIYRLNLGDFELTDGDLAWMRALFGAHDPIERLLLYHLAENPLPTDVTTRSERITVKANATLKVCRGFQTLFDVRTPESLTFYEFRGSGSGVEVIAPAFGNVVVPREHISRIEPVVRETHTWWNLESHSIKSLEIRSFGEQDDPEHVNRMRNLGGLLGIIGRPLEELSLLCDLPQPEELLDMVWPACVNLKKLEMYYPNFRSLQYLVDAYESGECSIQSLYLEELRLVDASSMELFIATLADPTSRLARTLLELRLMLKGDNEAFAAGQHCIALAKALPTNETLKYLSVNGEEEYYANVKPLYDQLHNSWIPGFVSRDLFPLSCKCAFLSVVEKMNGRDQTQEGRYAGASSIAQLDSRVLSLIFEMSGTPKRRTVILRRSE